MGTGRARRARDRSSGTRVITSETARQELKDEEKNGGGDTGAGRRLSEKQS